MNHLRNFFCSLVVLVGATFQAHAQLIEVPPETTTCPNRPDDPPIIQEMSAKDAYRTLLLQAMYSAYRYRLVVENRTCTCDDRFPPWEEIVTYYLATYAGLDNEWEVLEARKPYDEAKRIYRDAYRTICLDAGNWE